MTSAELIPSMLADLEETLRLALAQPESGSVRGLYEMLAFHMGWAGEGAGRGAGGKRLRPLLTLLCCGGVCGEWQPALPFAAAVELVHNFSLIHDDIQDQGTMRRGRPTVWKLWGAAQGINAGDILFSLALLCTVQPARSRDLDSSLASASARVLLEACIHLTEGQYIDLAAEDNAAFSLARYWEMVEGKTAALLKAACLLGALAGKSDARRQEQLGEFGRLLGLAFQARDDWLGLWGDPRATGKSASDDLTSRKKSLPIVFGLENSPEFRSLFALPSSPGPTPGMLEALERAGAREYAASQAAAVTRQAFAALEQVSLKEEYMQALRELTETLLTRVR
ncbi:MAG: polyprenyl synthetase family protein [Anaerolineales bacterium]|jgi:geranylgeranyl diphosphate synthase type I